MIKTWLAFNVGGRADITMSALDFKKAIDFDGERVTCAVHKVGKCTSKKVEFILRAFEPSNSQRGRAIPYNGLVVLSFTVPELGELDLSKPWQATLVKSNETGLMLFRVEAPWKEEDF